jgi:hypothetical protein
MGNEVGHIMIPSLTTIATYKESYPGKALDKLNLSSRQVPNPGFTYKKVHTAHQPGHLHVNTNRFK